MAYPHYAAGWAVAGDTPFTWTKQVAGNYGGTSQRNGSYWPKGSKRKAKLRSQFHHVIDIAPTILEAAGLPEPKMVNGIAQIPIQGVSMVYTFDDAKAKSRHKTQYFEISEIGQSITMAGWHTLSTGHAWEAATAPLLEDKVGTLPREEDFSSQTILPRRIRRSSRKCRTCFFRRQ